MLVEDEAGDRASFEDAYFALSAKIRELLFAPTHSNRGVVNPSPSNVSDTRESAMHVRLPKLNLPTFSGKYDEWFPFYDAFNSSIHSNISISNVQRLQYLRTSLSGEAADVISSLEISDLNYEVAWKLLRDRYDNKRVIVHTHIKAIMELPCSVKENSSELRQIADGASKHIRALQALKRPTSHWDDLLVHILSAKLDAVTLREWQTSLTGTDLPNLQQFLDFVNHRCQVLEATSKSANASSKPNNAKLASQVKRQTACAATLNFKCSFCQGSHSIYKCKDFLALSVSSRNSEIRKRKICINCLRSTEHKASQCPSGTCRTCKGKHNTLLHATSVQEHEQEKRQEEASALSPTALVMHAHNSPEDQCVVLSTAVIHVHDGGGRRIACRALLDCGSQANFISKKCLLELGLKPQSTSISISGINVTTSASTQIVRLKFQSRLNSYSAIIDCIVTEQITDRLPALTIDRNKINIPGNLKLADPHFFKSSTVDILLGADIFWELLCVGQHDQLSRFWQQENSYNDVSNHTLVEAHCEQHFLDNVSRDQTGRFIVKLPLKEQLIAKIGDSRDTALKRLQGMERRFQRAPNLKAQYVEFMNEYASLGHMKVANIESDEDSTSFYLPHHCVFKTADKNSKIRVVFDASCKSSTGVSLNDALTVGPVVQQDLMSILLRFRTHRYAISADIIKMYRQILVDPSQTRLQKILWRTDVQSDVTTYELTTVTYGTFSALYLATRCLKYLAEQYVSEFPVGSKCVERDFYVDDLLTGADTITDAESVIRETTQLLQLGSFKLSKWASNCSQLLPGAEDHSRNLVPIGDSALSRVLGIHWDQNNDELCFFHEDNVDYSSISKRVILSGTARLYDSLGLLGPVIVVAKIIMQELWQAGHQWDESVSQDIQSRWMKLRSQLVELNELRVPRCVKFTADPRLVQVHWFCDASQRAYGACIYLRTETTNGYRVELLCSRSRVAPLRAISLHRLELSAALLLSQLLEKVRSSFDLSHMNIFLWSDSTIALNWLSSPSRKWTAFVANRVGEIQRLTKIVSWRHIQSSDNPVDALSRGLTPQELTNSSLWWQGPEFLRSHQDDWPSGKFTQSESGMPEMQKITVAAVSLERSVVDELVSKFSSLTRICRVPAYCLRFRKAHRPSPPTTLLSHNEIAYALNVACKAIQRASFPNEYGALSKGKSISASSKILSLSPYMDDTGLIRVGGRLKNSRLQFDAQHPILLPREHELTKRVINYEHVTCTLERRQPWLL
ncbi:PREDICTED: uncharacterized protein LOC108780351 [Cyphomyrmex costatus]|uniref:uncharacterized protein LOC108780351 n=1 Tax=Cyphomyrmex costatus TaxID=456900 RepID=UPI00085245F5|nr:PREDICTED: uncharacterized protein LOC108780351 [Cyphomyrmex costatus]